MLRIDRPSLQTGILGALSGVFRSPLNLALCLLLFLFILRFGDYRFLSHPLLEVHLLDDQMITQRVAYNFHLHHLPYFNPGEPVAATTSLAWPILLSVLYYFARPDGAVSVVLVGSALCWIATAAIAANLRTTAWQSAATLLVIGLSSSTLEYAASGWEHVPQALFVTLALALVWDANRECRTFGELEIPIASLFCAAIAYWLRPDAAPIAAILTGVWFLTRRRWARWQSYPVIAALLAFPILYEAAMWHYFHDLLPNTAYLKSLPLKDRAVGGFFYLIDPKRSGLVPWSTVYLLTRWSRWNAAERLILTLVVVQLLYVWSVGGDVFLYGRFLLIFEPLVAWMVVRSVSERLDGKDGFAPAHASIGVMALLALAEPILSGGALQQLFRERELSSSFSTADPIETQMALMDVVREKLRPQDGSIGLHALGIAYHIREFHVVDFLGKAEPHIAHEPIKSGPIGHNKWDYDYAFSHYNIAAVPAPEDLVQRTRASLAMHRRPRIEGHWEACVAKLLTDGRYTFVPASQMGLPPDVLMGLFVRNDLVGRFVGAAATHGGTFVSSPAE